MPGITSTRRLEFTRGGSDKFWEFTVSGKEVTVRFGRRGSTGQTQIKSFPDAAFAQQYAENLLRQKLRKGYVEVGKTLRPSA